jgi:hypothetical protein
MAATGWLWLVIAVPLAGHALYLQRIPGVAAGSGWMSAPAAAVHGVLTPVLASGVLAPAAVWALASTTLPWIRRPRQVPLLRAAITVAWAAATAAATAIVLGAATRGHGVIMPGEGLLGAVACAFAALARELPAGAGPPAPTQPTPFSNLRSMKSP